MMITLIGESNSCGRIETGGKGQKGEVIEELKNEDDKIKRLR